MFVLAEQCWFAKKKCHFTSNETEVFIHRATTQALVLAYIMGNQESADAIEPLTMVYKDEYVMLDETGITINWYYFPAGPKRILYGEILRVSTDKELGLGNLGYKTWGKHPTI